MSTFRAWVFCLLAVFFVREAGAQGRPVSEAAALLRRVAEQQAARPHLEVVAYSRELGVAEVEDAESPTPVYRVSSAEYGRLVITRRLPDDWRIVCQQEQVSRGEARAVQRIVFGKTGEGDSSVLVFNTTTNAPSRITLPAGMFKQEVNERMGRKRAMDAVFQLLFDERTRERSRWAVFHGDASELRIEGTEEVNGVQLTRIVSAWPPSTVTRLWVDTESLTLVRKLEIPGEQSLRMRMPIEVKETIYCYHFDKGAADADFDLEAGWGLATPNIASAAGFSPSTELFAAITSGGTIKPETPVAKLPKTPKSPNTPPFARPSLPPTTQEVAGTPAPPPSPEPAPAVKPAVEEQLLTPVQMEAIVLIEGADGVGSGFVARIRDVDFVVTNQHVIGGNDKLRVTTLGGVPIKVGATFGAMGRDIALLRIEGGHGGPALKLAEDPVKTVKLGDKVAVVGNRRGGGVATQVSGVVRGIGPDKVEVDAPFQPGNSGSPILHVASGEVIGLATYSQTRTLDALDGSTDGSAGAKAKGDGSKTEQRWFGYRADGVTKWETIDLAKWRLQAKRIADFEADSDAIYHTMNGRFKEAYGNPRVRVHIDRFEERLVRGGNSQAVVMQEVHELFRGLRAIADSGVKDLKEGEFYDYFRTSLYWETSIPEQLRAREELARRLDRSSQNASAFLAKLRR